MYIVFSIDNRMVKYCDECGSLLTPITSTGELIFHCACGKPFKSVPEDTLRSEEYLEVVELRQKYEVFIKNSAFDPAGKKVAIECTKCFMPYLTLIYIGSSETPLYTCTCGQRYTVSDIEALQKKTEDTSSTTDAL